MLRNTVSLNLVVFGLGVTSAAAANCSSLTCTTSGGHIIVSRESGAPAGTSAMNIIALGVTNQCAGSDIAEVPYPATIDDYLNSEQEGVGNLTELVLEYQECCPDSRMVLLGYSQVSKVVTLIHEKSMLTSHLSGRTNDDGLPLRHQRDRLPYD